MNVIEFDNYIAFHPGYYIEEYLEENGISKDCLAGELNMTLDDLEEIINGNTKLTKDVIDALSRVTKTSKTLWIKLTNQYEKDMLKIRSEMERGLN